MGDTVEKDGDKFKSFMSSFTPKINGDQWSGITVENMRLNKEVFTGILAETKTTEVTI